MAEKTKRPPEEFSKDLAKSIEAGHFVIGLKQSMKALRARKAVKIVYAKNIPQELEKEIKNNSEIAKVPVEMFNGSNIDLGVTCKRAHSVLVMAITKGKVE